MQLSYRQLQSELKELRTNAADFPGEIAEALSSVRLNSDRETLEGVYAMATDYVSAESDRLVDDYIAARTEELRFDSGASNAPQRTYTEEEWDENMFGEWLDSEAVQSEAAAAEEALEKSKFAAQAYEHLLEQRREYWLTAPLPQPQYHWTQRLILAVCFVIEFAIAAPGQVYRAGVTARRWYQEIAADIRYRWGVLCEVLVILYQWGEKAGEAIALLVDDSLALADGLRMLWVIARA